MPSREVQILEDRGSDDVGSENATEPEEPAPVSRPWYLSPLLAIGLAAIGLVLGGVGISGFMTAGSEAADEGSALEALVALEDREAQLLDDTASIEAEIDSVQADIAATQASIAGTNAETAALEASIVEAEIPVRDLQGELWDVYAAFQRAADLEGRISSAVDDAVDSGNRRDIGEMVDRVASLVPGLLGDFETAVGVIDQAIANAESMLVGADTAFEITEDFEGDVQAWEAGFASNGVAGSVDGGYVVSANDDKFLMWGISPYDLAEVTIEVTAEPIAGDRLGRFSYGVLCRATQTDYLGGYWFAVTGEGAYQVAWYGPGGDFIDLNDQAREDRYDDASVLSAAVNRGLNENQFRVTCSGSDLSLTVNGVPVWTGSDDNLTVGRIGLGAFSYGGEPVTVRFDDLRLASVREGGGS